MYFQLSYSGGVKRFYSPSAAHVYDCLYGRVWHFFLDFRMAHIHYQRYLQNHKNDIKHKEPVWLSGERIYFLISFLFLWSLFLLLTWMKMYGPSMCVCSVYSWWGLSVLPHPPLPMPRDPRKAEWQGSGWAKWWNDDHIMRSDSRMRGIIQRLHPSPTAMPFCCTALPAAPMMIDLHEMDHRKHPLIFQCFIKNIYLQLYPKCADPTHHIPPFSKWGIV